MKRIPNDGTTPSLASTLCRMRAMSGRTQAEVATRMGTKQASIARMEKGEQSPTVLTLQRFARANGFCLEIGFVRTSREPTELGSILLIDDRVDA